MKYPILVELPSEGFEHNCLLTLPVGACCGIWSFAIQFPHKCSRLLTAHAPVLKENDTSSWLAFACGSSGAAVGFFSPRIPLWLDWFSAVGSDQYWFRC